MDFQSGLRVLCWPYPQELGWELSRAKPKSLRPKMPSTEHEFTQVGHSEGRFILFACSFPQEHTDPAQLGLVTPSADNLEGLDQIGWPWSATWLGPSSSSVCFFTPLSAYRGEGTVRHPVETSGSGAH